MRVYFVLGLLLFTLPQVSACTYFDNPSVDILLTYDILDSDGNYITTLYTNYESDPCGLSTIMDQVEGNQAILTSDEGSVLYDISESPLAVKELPVQGGDWADNTVYLHSYGNSSAYLERDAFTDSPLLGKVFNIYTGSLIFNISLIHEYLLGLGYMHSNGVYSRAYNTTTGSAMSFVTSSLHSFDGYADEVLVLYSLRNATQYFDGSVLTSTEVFSFVPMIFSLVSGEVRIVEELSLVFQSAQTYHEVYSVVMASDGLYMANYSFTSADSENVYSGTDFWRVTDGGLDLLFRSSLVLELQGVSTDRVVATGEDDTLYVFESSGAEVATTVDSVGSLLVLQDYMISAYYRRVFHNSSSDAESSDAESSGAESSGAESSDAENNLPSVSISPVSFLSVILVFLVLYRRRIN